MNDIEYPLDLPKDDETIDKKNIEIFLSKIISPYLDLSEFTPPPRHSEVRTLDDMFEEEIQKMEKEYNTKIIRRK